MGYAVAVGDNGADGDVVAVHVAGVAHHALVQNTHGIVGGYLFGDAVNGPSHSVECAHINAIDCIARIRLLQLLDVFEVPSLAGEAVHHVRIAGLDNQIVDNDVVAV